MTRSFAERTRGRSVVTLVDVDAVDVIEAITELFEDKHHSHLAAVSENVSPHTIGFISETDEGEE